MGSVLAEAAPAGGSDEEVAGVLQDLFEIHHAMLRCLLARDDELSLHLGEFLEDVANRYIDLSEMISRRHLTRLHRLNSIE